MNMNRQLLLGINWIFCSLKEQYQFINSLMNQLLKDQIIKDHLKREIYFYKTSLILFKKSFSIYQEKYNKNIINEKDINDIKIYLRRCLFNLNECFNLFSIVSNSLMVSSILYHEIINKIKGLISSIKDLGRNLDLLNK